MAAFPREPVTELEGTRATMSGRVTHRMLKPFVELRAGEAPNVLLMFGYSLLAMTAYNIVQPITRSRFISALGADNLPYVLLVSVFIIGLLMQGYSKLGGGGLYSRLKADLDSLNKGKANNVRPSDIVGQIAFHANIPGYTIGKIHIEEKITFVDVPEDVVDQVIKHSGNYKIGKEKFSVVKAT